MQSKETKTGAIKDVSLQTGQLISHGAIVRIIGGVLLLLLLIHIGFYKTYIQHFPGFADYTTPAGRKVHFTWVMHFHGMMMIGWLLMLLLQPILILKGKISWHRRVGSFSYVLAPLALWSMFLVTQSRFHEVSQLQGHTAAVARLWLNIPNLIFFPLLYGLALYYRKRSALHIAFMCGTAFLLIGPGLARLIRTNFGLTAEESAGITKLIVVAVAAAIAIADSVRKKSISPFTVVLAITVVLALCWFGRYSPVLLTIGEWISKIF